MAVNATSILPHVMAPASYVSPASGASAHGISSMAMSKLRVDSRAWSLDTLWSTEQYSILLGMRAPGYMKKKITDFEKRFCYNAAELLVMHNFMPQQSIKCCCTPTVSIFRRCLRPQTVKLLSTQFSVETPKSRTPSLPV